jgi:hypothetical protein
VSKNVLSKENSVFRCEYSVVLNCQLSDVTMGGKGKKIKLALCAMKTWGVKKQLHHS